jgi:hypothetical protein
VNESELFSLIATIEDQLPLQRDLLEALFGASFKGTVDHNRQPILVATVGGLEITFHAVTSTSEGSVSVHFDPPLRVAERTLLQRFPDGHSLPPLPPGYSPPGAQGIYIAERPWGQIWFALYTGDRLVTITLRPGMHGSPGV